MDAEVKSRRNLHKATIVILKIIPMVLALTTLLNQTLSYFYIDIAAFGFIGGISLIPMIFLYIASYCFQFCSYHRMFLHYVVICDIINIYDYYIGVPISNIALFLVNLIIAGICLFIILYLYLNAKNSKKLSVKNNK